MLASNGMPLGEITKAGNPYHGTITDGVLTLPNATTKAWPTGSGRGCTLVQFASLTVPENPADEVAAGLRWDASALLQGLTLRYPMPSSQPQIGWSYRTESGMVWRIAELANFYADGPLSAKYPSLRLGAFPLSGAVADPVVCATIAPPTYPGSFYNGRANPAQPGAAPFAYVQWVLVPSKTGGKCLAHAYWVREEVGGNRPSINHLQTYYRDLLLGIIEITLSGGDHTTPPTVSSTVLYHYAGLRSETSNLDTYTGSVHFFMSGTVSAGGGSRSFSGSAYWSDDIIQPNNFFSGGAGGEWEWVMAACYSDDDTRVVFSEYRKAWTEESSVGNSVSISWSMPDNGIGGVPSNAVSTITTNTVSRLTAAIKRNGATVCTATFTHSKAATAGVTWLYPGASFPVDILTTEEWDWMTYGPVVSSSVEDRSESAFGALRGEVLSMQTVGLAFRGLPENRYNPTDSTTVLIDAYKSAIYSIAGPKTQSTFGKAAMVIKPMGIDSDAPYSGSAYERPGVCVPYAVAHPVTGAFAYGHLSGFV